MAKGKLKGKVALITGSSSGIGLQMAREFAQEGATVVLNGLHKKQLEEVLGEFPDDCWGQAASVADSKAVAALFKKIKSRHGRLDVLVNNAGIGKTVQVEKMTNEQWDEMLGVHLGGTFYCTREALKLMIAQKSGKIINIASICGMTGCAMASHYSAAKGGIMGFTRSVAREAIGHGINVNAIAPGYIDTPMLKVLDEQSLKAVISQVPQGRLGTTHEIASLAVWLASDGGNYMVGQVVSPNGGFVI